MLSKNEKKTKNKTAFSIGLYLSKKEIAFSNTNPLSQNVGTIITWGFFANEILRQSFTWKGCPIGRPDQQTFIPR